MLMEASRGLASIVRRGNSPLGGQYGLVSYTFRGEHGHGPGVNREALAIVAKSASALSIPIPIAPGSPAHNWNFLRATGIIGNLDEEKAIIGLLADAGSHPESRPSRDNDRNATSASIRIRLRRTSSGFVALPSVSATPRVIQGMVNTIWRMSRTCRRVQLWHHDEKAPMMEVSDDRSNSIAGSADPIGFETDGQTAKSSALEPSTAAGAAAFSSSMIESKPSEDIIPKLDGSDMSQDGIATKASLHRDDDWDEPLARHSMGLFPAPLPAGAEPHVRVVVESHFRAIGRVMGRSIMDSLVFPLPLSPLAFQAIRMLSINLAQLGKVAARHSSNESWTVRL